MKLGIIIFARISSKRLPSKALKKVNGSELLFRAYNSCNISKDVPTIIATSNNSEDNLINDFANENNMHIFRGSLDNVLERAYYTCLNYELTHFFRFCGDRPLFPKSLIRFLINSFNNPNIDLLSSNFSKNKLPPGLTAEIVSRKSLEYILKKTKKKSHQEHLTSYIYENQGEFFTEGFENIPFFNWGDMKFVLDTKEDLKKINFISKKVDSNIHSYNIIQSLEKLHFYHSLYSNVK